MSEVEMDLPLPDEARSVGREVWGRVPAGDYVLFPRPGWEPDEVLRIRYLFRATPGELATAIVGLGEERPGREILVQPLTAGESLGALMALDEAGVNLDAGDRVIVHPVEVRATNDRPG